MKNHIIQSITFALALSIMPMTALHAMNAQPKDAENTVSILYYPIVIDIGCPGHVKLEINGTAYNRPESSKKTEHNIRSLDSLIKKAESGGKPFFRFIFDADETTISHLQEHIQTVPAPHITCSFGAVQPLRKFGICSIPAVLSLSPLSMASYLTISKQLGFDKIEKIEYYGNTSLLNNARMLSGILVESGIISEYILLAMTYSYVAILAYDNQYYYTLHPIIEGINRPLENSMAVGHTIMKTGIAINAIKALGNMATRINQEQTQNLTSQSTEHPIRNPFNAFGKAAKTPLFKSILSTLYY